MDPEISGITLAGREQKISLYADDISLTLKNDKTSINKCFDLIRKFGSISGLKLNERKTEILHLGQEEPNLPAQKAVKILGVKLLTDKPKMEEVNISSKLQTLENDYLYLFHY